MTFMVLTMIVAISKNKEAYKLVSERFQKQIIGTVYGGELQSEVGTSLDW